MNHKMQKTIRNIKQTKILAVLLLSIFTLSIPIWGKNTENIELEDINIDETVILDKTFLKELINDNLQFQSGPGSCINKEEIERVAFGQFLYYRKHASVFSYPLPPLVNPYVKDGKIFFTKKSWGSDKLLSIPININRDGSFSVKITTSEEMNGACWYGTIYGKRRDDGYYYATVEGGQTNVEGSTLMRGVESQIFDKQGNVVTEVEIMQRAKSNMQSAKSYIQGELDKIQYLNGANKGMIAAIMTGNGVYDIDYLEKDSNHTIYADARNVSVEIRFVKIDSQTIYGVYVISSNSNSQVQESNNGSEIYAFKYSDESTLKKQRVKLMTKRVVQYDFDEQYPSTQKYTTGMKGREAKQSEEFTRNEEFIRKTKAFFRPSLNKKSTTSKTTSEILDSIYEDFMCEGVTYTIYTEDNDGRFYQNQQEMF